MLLSPHSHSLTLEWNSHHIEIDLLITGFEENPLPAVASLRHMMRNAGNDHARLTRHDLLPPLGEAVKLA